MRPPMGPRTLTDEQIKRAREMWGSLFTLMPAPPLTLELIEDAMIQERLILYGTGGPGPQGVICGRCGEDSCKHLDEKMKNRY